MSSKAHGALTAEIARNLKCEFDGYAVYHDHGSSAEGAQRIVSFFGEKQRHTLLSFVDIAVVRSQSRKAVALIEIEETEDKPKTILGDAFAVLMGESLSIDEEVLQVGPWTTLIIAVVSETLHDKRYDYIAGKVEKARASMGTGNAAIAHIVLGSSPEKTSLAKLVSSLVRRAITRGGLGT